MSRQHMRTKRSRPHGGERNDPDLIAKARRALAEDHPHALLNLDVGLLTGAKRRQLLRTRAMDSGPS